MTAEPSGRVAYRLISQRMRSTRASGGQLSDLCKVLGNARLSRKPIMGTARSHYGAVSIGANLTARHSASDQSNRESSGRKPATASLRTSSRHAPEML